MDVSTGLPRNKGLRGMTTVVRARASPVVISRVTETTGSLDEVTTTETEHTESVWLFDTQENVADELLGERVNGSLGGLVVADGTVDLSINDRVTYGGVEYELDTVVGHPNDGEADGTSSEGVDFWLLSFERRQ